MKVGKHIIIPSILSGLVTWIFMYLDAKLFDQPKTTGTYVKGVLFNMVLVGLIVHFFCGKTLSGPAVPHVNAVANSAIIPPPQAPVAPPITQTGFGYGPTAQAPF